MRVMRQKLPKPAQNGRQTMSDILKKMDEDSSPSKFNIPSFLK